MWLICAATWFCMASDVGAADHQLAIGVPGYAVRRFRIRHRTTRFVGGLWPEGLIRGAPTAGADLIMGARAVHPVARIRTQPIARPRACNCVDPDLLGTLCP